MKCREAQQGTALILALFFAVISTGIVAAGSIYLKSTRTRTTTNFQVYSQANQFARSGLTEALSWFRRQSTQPVLVFAPVVDENATPPISDTIDADLGIVREFRIFGNQWGRYEVWKEWDSDPDTERAEWRTNLKAEDISNQKGLGTSGSSWRVRSVGYLYENNDSTKSFRDKPNRIVASRMLESEILRMKISPPGQAALSVGDGNSAHVNTNGRISGGSTGAGIFYPQDTGTPTTGPPSQNRVTGLPRLATTDSYDDSYRGVFGITYEEIRSIANTYATTANDFPSPIPTNTIVVAEMSSLHFDAARPLQGTGLVVVKGNVVINPGSNSSFTGFLYVDGNLTMRAPSEILGAVVVTGNMTLQGSGDYATITFDDDALTALRLEIGQYRLSGAIRPIHSQE